MSSPLQRGERHMLASTYQRISAAHSDGIRFDDRKLICLILEVATEAFRRGVEAKADEIGEATLAAALDEATKPAPLPCFAVSSGDVFRCVRALDHKDAAGIAVLETESQVGGDMELAAIFTVHREGDHEDQTTHFATEYVLDSIGRTMESLQI